MRARGRAWAEKMAARRLRDPLDIVTDDVLEAMAMPYGRRRCRQMAHLAEVHLAMTVGFWRQYKEDCDALRKLIEPAETLLKAVANIHIIAPRQSGKGAVTEAWHALAQALDEVHSTGKGEPRNGS